jgi:hypothetical protein
MRPERTREDPQADDRARRLLDEIDDLRGGILERSHMAPTTWLAHHCPTTPRCGRRGCSSNRARWSGSRAPTRASSRTAPPPRSGGSATCPPRPTTSPAAAVPMTPSRPPAPPPPPEGRRVDRLRGLRVALPPRIAADLLADRDDPEAVAYVSRRDPRWGWRCSCGLGRPGGPLSMSACGPWCARPGSGPVSPTQAPTASATALPPSCCPAAPGSMRSARCCATGTCRPPPSGWTPQGRGTANRHERWSRGAVLGGMPASSGKCCRGFGRPRSRTSWSPSWPGGMPAGRRLRTDRLKFLCLFRVLVVSQPTGTSL